jgi:uncharacterized membrane protein
MKMTELLLRWTPTFLAFPIGGLLAKLLFGSASSVLKSVGGGLIVGFVVGLIQYLSLQKYGVTSSWVIASGIAVSIAALINSYVFSFKFDTASLVGSGLVAGLVVGIAQSLSQSREIKFVAFWTLCTAIAWSVAWFITSKVIVDPEAQYHVFGSSGAVLTTFGLGICLKYILPLADLAQNSIK